MLYPILNPETNSLSPSENSSAFLQQVLQQWFYKQLWTININTLVLGQINTSNNS